MDLQEEITNHLEWIEMLASLLGSEEMTEDSLRTIRQHDRCKLGQWLDSEASESIRALPEYETLIKSHETFHNLAAGMISAAQQGNEADTAELHAQFIEASQQVVGSLRTLQASSGQNEYSP